MNNHILCNVDTDSFSVCKPDMSPWSQEEKETFRKYINSQFPELIRWEDDGEYIKFLVVKTKNYANLIVTGKQTLKLSVSTLHNI